jgi:hypothetical protein
MASEGHLARANDPSNFECIDAMKARYHEIRIERAVNEEVSHHLLKLYMLKNPEKFAELDWIFPKLARWVALLRQAEKNVAERDRLAAEAAAFAIPNNELMQHSIEHEQGLLDSPTPSFSSLSSSAVFGTNPTMQGDEHDSSLKSGLNAACKRSFYETISSSDLPSCGAFPNIVGPLYDRSNRYAKSSATGLTLSDPCMSSFASLSSTASGSGFCSADGPVDFPVEDPSSVERSIVSTSTALRKSDTTFAQPTPRANHRLHNSHQGDQTSFAPTDMHSNDPSESLSSTTRSALDDKNTLALPSAAFEIAVDVMFQRVHYDSAAKKPFTASDGSISQGISEIDISTQWIHVFCQMPTELVAFQLLCCILKSHQHN